MDTDIYQKPHSDHGTHSTHDMTPIMSTDTVSGNPTSMDISVNKRSIAAVSWACGHLDAFGIGSNNCNMAQVLEGLLRHEQPGFIGRLI